MKPLPLPLKSSIPLPKPPPEKGTGCSRSPDSRLQAIRQAVWRFRYCLMPTLSQGLTHQGLLDQALQDAGMEAIAIQACRDRADRYQANGHPPRDCIDKAWQDLEACVLEALKGELL